MLNRSDKEAIVASVKTDIERSKAVFLTNLIGVTANESVAVRKSVREAKGKIVIARNTLLARAAAGTKVESLIKDLKGPTAVAFAFDDAAAVAKRLFDVGKENEKVSLRGAILDGKMLDAAQIEALASLPSREQLLGTLLATFNAPISALARVLNSIKEKKEKETGAVAAPAQA